GFVPAFYFPRWTVPGSFAYWALVYGLVAIAGHVRTPYLAWKAGGKGVATGCGVFLALAPVPTLMVIALGVLEGPSAPVFALGVVVALFVLWTHRANLDRLRRGEEHRVGRRPA